MDLKWKIEFVENNKERIIEDITPFDEEIHVKEILQKARIKRVSATINLPITQDDRFFLNGYQTWTYSRECKSDDKERGLHGIPSLIKNHYNLAGYGDYNFVHYSNKKGFLHGFSFMTIRQGDKFCLIASLNEKPGWTIFHLNTNTQTLLIERDAEGLEVNGEYSLFDLFTSVGREEEVYDNWFKVLKIECNAKPLAGYSSWYNHYQNISEKTIIEDLRGCRRILEKGDLFQIDDGWEKHVGDWRVNGDKFPNGIKPLIDEIHSEGYIAGLWLAPFIVEEDSVIYKEHPDWLLQRDGKGNKCGCNWSGFWSLDIDNKEVQDYLKDVFSTVFNEWKIDFVKLDFLYGVAPWGTKDETRSGRMIRATDFLRSLCKDKLILGCGIPVMAGFSLTDYSRLSCDVTLDWDDKVWMKIIHSERPSTKRAIETNFHRRMLSKRAFIMDPDVFFLRDNNIRLSKEKKLMLAKADALFKGLFLTSDNPSLYTEEMVKEYKEVRHIWESAENIRVDRSGHRPKFLYTLDGKEEELTLSF